MSVIEATPVTSDPASRVENFRLMGGAVSLAGCKTVDDVLTRADLDWSADKYPVHTHFQGSEIPVPDRYAVVRSDKGVVLGDVGKAFVPVQNRDLVDFGSVLKTEADTDWDAGGSMKGSQVAFLSFKVPHSIVVAGSDQVDSYVLLSNGHNGSHALRGAVMPYRLTCSNQVAGAFRSAKMSFSFRHVGDMTSKVAEARAALGLVGNYMDEFEVIANSLADIDVDLTFYEDFVSELIVIDGEGGVRTNAAKARQRAALRQNWNASETLTPDLRNTGWGAFNLVTEVIDHGNLDVRKSKQDKGERRFLSSLEGPGATMRQRALDLLLTEVEVPGSTAQAVRDRKVLASVGGSL